MDHKTWIGLLALCTVLLVLSGSAGAQAPQGGPGARLGLPAAADPDPESSYESYFLYLGNHPTEANPGWHVSVQGITHDDDHWFMMVTDRAIKPVILQWRRDVEFASQLSPDSDDVFMREHYKYGASWRGEVGPGMWFLVYGMNGTASL